ncbi:MAG TPA: hypothetical protein VLB68_12070 [Pyrinomonadaceae bacterium]|nr:hypothetical protein [Pyrinomonadaceae bacterium]
MTKSKRLGQVLCVGVIAISIWSGVVQASVVQATIGSTQPSSLVTKSKPKASTTGGLTEEFTFLIKDFKIDHQGENNNLNITIRYRYKARIPNSEYPDFTGVANDIETLLANYPNRTDYWEILNKRITMMVLEKYPAIIEVTSEVQVSPSPKNHYIRSSIVTRDRTSMSKRTPR